MSFEKLVNTSFTNVDAPLKNISVSIEDIQATSVWLREVEDSKNTFQSYKKEVERFILWISSHGLSLKDANREDILNYKKFLANPEPSDRWIGPPKPRHHPDWRPFAKRLQNSSIKQALIIIKSLFNYLSKSGYLSRNPFSFGRKEIVKVENFYKIERFLERKTFYFVLDVIETLPRESRKEILYAERARWLFYLLYFTGARRSEVSKSKMKDFKKENGLWWWEVSGKGNKKGTIPCQDELLEALIRYRRILNLGSDYPADNEETPLIASLSEKKKSNLSEKSIYLIVKNIFGLAAEVSKLKNKGFEEKLEKASTHWIRHTSASHQLEAGVPLIMVSKNLRHSNIQTTQRYLHTEENERHRISQMMRINNSDT